MKQKQVWMRFLLWHASSCCANIANTASAADIKSIFTLKKPILFIAYTFGIWVCYLLTTYSILMAFDFTEHLGVDGALSTLVFSTIGVIIPAPAGGAAIYSIYFGLNQIYSIPIDQAKAIAIVMFSSSIIMIIIAGTISYIIMAKRTKA